MTLLFSFPILTEPDIQRLSGFILQALRQLSVPTLITAAKIPLLNQQLRHSLHHPESSLHLSVVLTETNMEARWDQQKFVLARGISSPSPDLMQNISQYFRDRMHTSNPELLRKQNESIRKKLKMAQEKAQNEIRTIEHQLVHRKKELDLYIKKAETDSLTGLLNRGAYDRMLHEALRELNSSPQAFTLIFLDLDYFKEVNDTFGHAYGDEILRSMALAMRAAIREGQDLACRIGGDEFAILLFSDVPQAHRISQTILSDMSHKVSIGIAPFMEKDTPENMAARADSALYHAKQTGRGKISLPPAASDITLPGCHICG
ncbi:GGDEF domain-containing protein [Desulfobotulus sp. H1]|uniref:diguanylate cyclase n=1 Tax=Desulfobotulus pelophilus TaxID=2823377 RepID=A0ABT3N5R4_9BACT|nr:GGDEF domain-containing protein [Desulfobotulus pelophilus]MCW7752794.1 GGDEF domain-containing protein [Desulfobotulus pelophilus]